MKKLLLLLSLTLFAVATWATPQGYAELAVNNDKTFGDADATYTLTFRYGEMPANTAMAHYYDTQNTPFPSVPHSCADWAAMDDIWYQVDITQHDGYKSFVPRYNITNAVFDESFANARPKSIAYWFFNPSLEHSNKGIWRESYQLQSITGMEFLNTSETIYANQMFFGCAALTSLDLSTWDTSKMTDMSGLFTMCSSLVSLNTDGWDTSNVTNMSAMFWDANSLLSVDVSHWDTHNVTDMGTMFYRTYSLTDLNLSNFDFSNVEKIELFLGNPPAVGKSSSLKTLTLGKIDTSTFPSINVNDIPKVTLAIKNVETVTFTDVNAFLANKTAAAELLNLLKTASSSAKITLDDNITPEQKAWFEKIMGEGNVSVAEGKSVVESVSVKIGSLGQTTLFCSYDLDFSDESLGLRAYIATAFTPTADGSSGELIATRIRQVPANTGILILGAQGTYSIPTGLSTIIISNMFRGTLEAIADGGLPMTETVDGVNSTNFKFYSDGSFRRVDAAGEKLGAGKAYLTLPSYMLPSATSASAPIRVVFNDMDNATAIEDVDATEAAAEKVYYTLSGQRVSNPAKGIYIVNGKKVLVK